MKPTTHLPPRLPTLLIVALSVSAILAGCGATPTATQSTPTTSAPPATVSIQLSWTHTIEWAGFYVAESKGLYSKQNLTVTLKPGVDAIVSSAHRLFGRDASLRVVEGNEIRRRASISGRTLSSRTYFPRIRA